MNLTLSAQALGLVPNQQLSTHNKFHYFIGPVILKLQNSKFVS
jgi:hypothetical protein